MTTAVLIRVAIYTRVSTQEQAREGYSIKEQALRLQKLCEAHEWTVVRIYSDPGFSGASMDRPALRELLADIHVGKIDKVLVYKLDRLSRSQKDTLRLIEDEFIQNGVEFESLTESLDTATPAGRAMIGILAAFAQLEREQIKERMSLGMEARVRSGKWRGGRRAPYGYFYDREKEMLIPNEETAPIVKTLFREYADGAAIHELERWHGHASQGDGDNKLDNRNIRYILKNRAYLGELRWKGKWIRGKHEPLVDGEVFEKVNARLKESFDRYVELGSNSGARATSTNLGGLLFCARCGAKYAKALSGHRDYKLYEVYSCYSRNKKTQAMIKDPACKNKIWKVEELDTLIFDEIRKLRVESDRVERKNGQKEKSLHKKALEKNLDAVSRKISRLIDLYSDEQITADELSEKIKSLEKERSRLREAISGLKEDKSPKDVKKLVEDLESALESGSLQERRAIIEQLIRRIDLDGDDVTIHWAF